MVTFPLFQFLRWLLIALTGRGIDRADWVNNLHHKLSYRLHKMLPFFRVAGIQKVPAPGMAGKFLYVRAEDGGVGHQLIMYREYEAYESSLVRKFIRPGMTVYNIGANLGYYTLLASECVGPKGQVFAFEPAPANFELLAKNISENKLGNVELYPLAVGSIPGIAALSLSNTNSGDHRLQDISNREQVAVSVTSIDSFISEGHQTPDAIIIDVQGAELDVLLGASNFLSNANSLVLFTEFWPGGLDERHPDGAKKMLQTFSDCGMSLNLIDEKQRSVTPISAASLLGSIKGVAEVNLLCLLLP